ncbi:hypothetical protein D9J65_23375 [Escherichia coli]|nr:hypothetical protein [Escherichia coli]MHT88002.1 hypothetical protein [Escherichia coli]
MRKIIQISGWLLFIMGLVTIMLFSGSEYQWMQDMDPPITALPQGNGNRDVIRKLIYSISVAIQIVLYFLSVSRTGKGFSALGILLLLITAWSSEQ